MISSQHKNGVSILLEGRHEEALAILGKIKQTPEVMNDRAVALYHLRRTDEALELLEAALSRTPKLMPAVLNHRYMILARDAVYKPSTHKIVADWGPPVKPPPTISVIIPTYNRQEFLDEAVRSILGQTFPDFEVIVVSDGPISKAEEVLRSIKSDRIRHIRIEHGGISAALNAGVAKARGRFIAYLDDDDAYSPYHLDMLLQFLDKNPDARIAYSYSWLCEKCESDNGWETTEKKIFYPEPFDLYQLKKKNIIQTTGSIMHRRDLVDEVGGFNEGIMGCQDWEWYLRISERHPFHLVPNVTLEHRFRKGRNTQLTADPRVMRRSDVTVRYIHNLLSVTSHIPGNFGYRRAMKVLGGLTSRWPDLLDMLDIRMIPSLKPYAFVYRIGTDLVKLGEKNKARHVFFASFRVAPWETKTWGKIFFPSEK